MKRLHFLILTALLTWGSYSPGVLTLDTTAYDTFVKNMQATTANLAAQQTAAATAATQTAQKQALIKGVVGLCPLMFNQSNSQPMQGTERKLKKTAKDVSDIAVKAREDAGYIYEDDIDKDISMSVGKDMAGKFAEGCDHFMNSEGKMGSWGSFALQAIKDKPKAFGDNVPDDITKWCPNYPKMNKSQRNLFWVWTMMSMASSESSCKPTNDNKNARNGTAVGLFQLESRVCPKANDLHEPKDNIQCAVDLLSDELESRDTLMTPTSKGSTGTYWGPLRSDDWNKKRGGDIAGAKKTRELMKQYRYCN
ncbi:hypothetical protein [Bdellovibrio sp. NC01]|uniref:hypothetical protein n=1 Tax=Bdellovibrio sp. NC01 TaxID=2220073 RepID=UPI00115914E3|nr:hypothetical protein [Bdellovibrio sp. NC01]